MRTDLKILRGSIDMHLHSSPCLYDQLLDDIEAAKEARDAGMRALVLKGLFEPTVGRAYLVSKIVGGIKVFGGIVLNYPVGGLNPFAVNASLNLGGKIVWMPTSDASNQIVSFQSKLGTYPGLAPRGSTFRKFSEVSGISVLTDKDELVPDMDYILGSIADFEAILATGHLSLHEVRILVEEARKAGVEKIVLTHAESRTLRAKTEDLAGLTKMGAYAEFVYSTVSPRWEARTTDEVMGFMRVLGPEHCIISSDLGATATPHPVDGLRSLIQTYLEKGLSEEDLEIMLKTNPSKLLGLE